jgi:glycosyltransferase involved in cell wall biosynthesis
MAKSLYEVIVVDDGSSDDTREVARSLEGKLNLIYIYQPDLGYRVASARNKGILMAKGEICVFVDSGIILDENCLNAHMDFHKEKGGMSAAIGYIYGFEENDFLGEILMDLIEPNDPSTAIKRLALDNRFHDVREPHYQYYNDQISDLPAPWVWFWTGHISVSRENLLRVNLFDENYDLRWGVEDNDLGFRLHHSGVKLQLLRAAKSIHYPHSKKKEERHLEGYKNCQYFHQKFNTLETGIFLDSFLAVELTDINRISLESKVVKEML